MHVAFFNRSFYPDTSATGQLLTELCDELVRRHGFRISVVAGVPLLPSDGRTREARGIVRRESYRGIDIFRARGTRFSKKRFAGRASNYVSYFLSACWAGLRLDAPDVVVALTDPPIIGIAAWLAAKRFRAPLVMSYRDLFPEVAVLIDDFHSDAVDAVLQTVNRWLVQKADRVVALGETMRQRLIENKGSPSGKTVIIPDWADTTAITPGVKRNPFSEAHGLADKFVVMHSGNIGLSQGLETVVDAAAILRECPDLQVVFVGEGVKKDELRCRASALGLTNVTFLPFEPLENLTLSYAAADVFIVSLQRGLAGSVVPSKIYGILAAGRPYVAAVDEACEVAALTRAHQCGLLCEPGNAHDLAGKIATFHRDRALVSAYGIRARAAGLAFDRAVQVDKYASVFREVVDSARATRARDRSEPIGPWAKRSFDVALSALGLVFSLPLWAVFAVAIKMEDGGAVFYGHERVGQGGRRFKVWKFRSMIPDAEALVGAIQAAPDDRRVTRIGHWLRATGLDELPQLWNILRGDMSFVGPRPLRPGEVEVQGGGRLVAIEEIPGFEERCHVRPGLTGLAQIYAPRDILRRRKFRYDTLYIDKQSWWLDLRLILLSFWITARGTWEARGEKF